MPHKNRDARNAWRRAYRAKNRERLNAFRRALWADPDGKRRATQKTWEKANPERANAPKRAYDLRNREWINAKARERYKQNREQQLARNRARADYNRQKAREWKEANRESFRESNRRRRSQKRGNGGGILNRDWLRLLNRYGGCCAYCGEPGITQDHVIPLVRGGSHAIGNVLPACLRCNSSKKDRLLVEWLSSSERRRLTIRASCGSVHEVDQTA